MGSPARQTQALQAQKSAQLFTCLLIVRLQEQDTIFSMPAREPQPTAAQTRSPGGTTSKDKSPSPTHKRNNLPLHSTLEDSDIFYPMSEQACKNRVRRTVGTVNQSLFGNSPGWTIGREFEFEAFPERLLDLPIVWASAGC